MEAAEPVKCDTPSVNSYADNFDLIEELVAEKNNEKYKIQLGTKENNNYLVIKSFSNSLKNIIYYQQSYSKNELRNISKIFDLYKSFKEIISFLKNKNKLYDIEEIKDELIIKFKFKSGNNIIKFNLKKQLMKTDDAIKYLLDEISNLNIKHKSDIIQISEKYKSEISNLEKENKKLWKEISNLKKTIKQSKLYALNEIYDLSNILNYDYSIDFIFDYIRENDRFSNFNFIKLLFRSSRDGDSSKFCHELCDNKQNVLVIILSDAGYVFGGYTKIGFKTNNINPAYVVDNNSFLFSVDLQKIYPAIMFQQHICHIADNYGLCFNGSLAFFDNFMHNSDGYIFGFNHDNNTEFYSKPSNQFEMNGGIGSFKCIELEVFQIY